MRNCLAVYEYGVRKPNQSKLNQNRRVLVRKAAVGRAEQQWNHQRPCWILETNPSGQQCFYTDAIDDAPLTFWHGEFQWEQLGNCSGLSEGWIPDLSFSGRPFLVHTEHFTRLISGYLKMFLLSSASQWPSKLQWVIGYFQLVIYSYRNREEMFCKGLTYCGRKRNLGQLHWHTATIGHHRLCNYPYQNCWVPAPRMVECDWNV